MIGVVSALHRRMDAKQVVKHTAGCISVRNSKLFQCANAACPRAMYPRSQVGEDPVSGEAAAQLAGSWFPPPDFLLVDERVGCARVAVGPGGLLLP